MDWISVGLLLLAAGCHALWNLRLKCCDDKNLVVWWGLIMLVPLAIPALWSGGVPLSIWPLLSASVVCQACYYYSLARAYQGGDFSLVYPVSRGTAPVLILLWSVLFLHERPHPVGLFGIFLIITGVTVAGGLWQLLRRGSNRAALKVESVTAAFQVALFISGYSTLDGAAVKQCQPAAYTACVFAFTALAVTPLLARRPWPELRAGWRNNRVDIVAIALLSLLAYGLVLMVYSRGTVSYAAAGREISIVFGALAGWRWLGEGLGATRVMGAMLIFSGIATIAIWG
ncbi:MAG: hypothetical protein EOP50_06065 [Sphingobacteriales bacterium]|nr:MAG: hypothetical protein EOP50_06065 [Sphingobacteriales bacterium]